MADTIDIEKVKTLTIVALASDDFLMETLVLKGGNAIDLLKPGEKTGLSRASYDLDFSIEEDFDGDLEDITALIEKTINRTFEENGLKVFDYKFSIKPSKIRNELKNFWGGYAIEFKLITQKEFERLEGNLEKIRRGAIAVRPNQSSKVEIEISKYEYTGDKREVEVEGLKIFIYSPQMMAFEKLRAICQQFPQYTEVIPSHSARPRSRDFYDIHLICEQHEIEVGSDKSVELVGLIFGAKKVPLSYIKDIVANAAVHRQDWQNLLDTLPAAERAEVKPFDHYLQFVIDKFKPFTSL